MKSQYIPTDDVNLTFPQFINLPTGAPIGGDTVTVAYLQPDLVTTGTVVATWRSAIRAWTAQIPAASYARGTWRVTALSDGVGAVPYTVSFEWGDYMMELGTPAQASALSLVGAAASDASSYAYSAATDALAAKEAAVLARQAALNRLAIDATAKVQTLYREDGTTILHQWNLKDDAGLPSATRIFERDPV